MTQSIEPVSGETIEEMLAGLDGVTPGPWWADSDGGDEFRAYAVFGPHERYGKPSSICDTHNAGEVVLEQEDGKPWDEQGRKNLNHIARCDPDTMRSILTELQSLRTLSAAHGEAVACMAAIDELRREEGDQVTILCDNPDFNGQPNNAVVVSAGWTNWQDFRVSGHTIKGALENAVAIKAMAPADRQEMPGRDVVDIAFAAAQKALAGTSSDIGVGELERVVIAILSALKPIEPERISEAFPGSCASCNGTGDLAGNPSYGVCPDCEGTGKFPAALNGAEK